MNSRDITATAPSILDLQAQIYEARIIIPLADLFLRGFLGGFFFPWAVLVPVKGEGFDSSWKQKPLISPRVGLSQGRRERPGGLFLPAAD